MSDKVLDFKPPIKGVDESLPARAQAELTCPAALNVRGNVPSLSDNKTVGKRDGYGRAFINAAGRGSGAAITGLTTALRASSTSPNTTGNYTSVVERWSGYAIDTPYQGYLNGYNFRGKYVRFSRKLADYAANGWQGSNAPPGESITLVRSGASSFTTTHVAALSTFADAYGLGFASSWATSNDMTITMNCFPRALAAADFVDCHNVGPFVRGHADLGCFVWAYLSRVAANQVQLVIEAVEGTTQTNIATSATVDLPGSATISNNAQIKLSATATGIEARLTWPDVLGTDEVRVSAANSRGVKTAVVSYDTLSGGVWVAGETITQLTSLATGVVLEDVTDGGTNKGYLVLYVTSGDFDDNHGLRNAGNTVTATSKGVRTYDNARAGWFFKSPGTSYPGSEPGYFRRISGMDYANLIPPEPEVIGEILGTQTAVGISRYYMPPNWLGVDIDSAQVGSEVSLTYGGTTGYSTTTPTRSPIIDDTNDWVYGPSTTRSTRTGFLTFDIWFDTPPTEHYPVEFTLRDITSSEDDTGGAVFCIENLHA